MGIPRYLTTIPLRSPTVGKKILGGNLCSCRQRKATTITFCTVLSLKVFWSLGHPELCLPCPIPLAIPHYTRLNWWRNRMVVLVGANMYLCFVLCVMWCDGAAYGWQGWPHGRGWYLRIWTPPKTEKTAKATHKQNYCTGIRYLPPFASCFESIRAYIKFFFTLPYQNLSNPIRIWRNPSPNSGPRRRFAALEKKYAKGFVPA